MQCSCFYFETIFIHFVASVLFATRLIQPRNVYLLPVAHKPDALERSSRPLPPSPYPVSIIHSPAWFIFFPFPSLVPQVSTVFSFRCVYVCVSLCAIALGFQFFKQKDQRSLVKTQTFHTSRGNIHLPVGLFCFAWPTVMAKRFLQEHF